MILFATIKHSGQVDKNGKPYILHCLTLLSQIKMDLELAQIAVGHDLLNETDTTEEELIEYGFSHRVIAGIKCLTFSDNEPFSDKRRKIMSNIDAMQITIKDLELHMDESPKQNKAFQKELKLFLAKLRINEQIKKLRF